MLWTIVIILIFNKMVEALPYIEQGLNRNSYVRLFTLQRDALRWAINHCLSEQRVQGQIVGMRPQPWMRHYNQYRGSGLFLGEFVVCAYATGQALAVGQGYGNRNAGLPMSAGYDFKLGQLNVEVKTLGGSLDSNICAVSESQWDSAHVFVLYNRNLGARNFRGIVIPRESVCVISNEQMRELMAF